MAEDTTPAPTQAEADALKLDVHGVSAELPAVTDVPMVSGNAAVGETLSCTMGNWTGEPTTYVYQWQRDGMGALPGGADSYVVAAADAGHSITCMVTATNAAGSTTAPPSNAIAIPAGGATRATDPHPPSRSR